MRFYSVRHNYHSLPLISRNYPILIGVFIKNYRTRVFHNLIYPLPSAIRFGKLVVESETHGNRNIPPNCS